MKFLRIKNGNMILSLLLFASKDFDANGGKKGFVVQEHNQVFFDTLPGNNKASYLYAPGLMGSEVVMVRYAPDFTAVTGEKVSCTSGGHVIGALHSAVTFAEIDLKKPQGFTLNPITAILNPIRRDLFPLAQRFFHESYGVTVVDNPASSKSVANYSFNFGRANIGQRKDINCLRKAYQAHSKKYSGTDIVLYGDSRGAATTFNFIAQHKPARVKAAVLEGIFDDIPHLLKHFLYNDKDPRAEKRLHNMLSFVMRSYKKKGPFPLRYAESIDDDIPLLFVTSLQDWVVPPQCTFNLYAKLKKRGHKNIHLLVLKKSSHPGYMLDNEEDKNTYESVVHAFYKQYGLPHNAARAQAGQKAFLSTRLEIEDLEKYELPTCPHCLV